MIPKSRPYLGTSELLAAISFGSACRQFETMVAEHAQARFGLAFSYAHAAFYALIKVLDLTEAEIILPAYTCDIMSEVVICTNNIPVFVDIDLADFNMDLDALKTAITPKTRMIVATHMFGYPTDIDAIRYIAGNEKIVIVEDAALRLPDAAGLRGDVGLFSFGPGKPLFTVRGGVSVTNDANLHEKLQNYRDHYMNQLSCKEWAKRWARLLVTYFSNSDVGYGLAIRLGLVKTSFERVPTSLDDSYVVPYANFQARMGLVLLKKLDILRTQRQAIIDFYDQELSNVYGFTPAPKVAGATYTYYTARVKNRDAIQFGQKMYVRGIETGRTYDYAVPDFKKYRSYVKSEFPCAAEAGQQVVNLPIHTNLSKAKAQFIVNNIRQILQEVS